MIKSVFTHLSSHHNLNFSFASFVINIHW